MVFTARMDREGGKATLVEFEVGEGDYPLPFESNQLVRTKLLSNNRVRDGETLAGALAVLEYRGKFQVPKDLVVIGDLKVTPGETKPVLEPRGCISRVEAAVREGKRVLVPFGQAYEAALVPGAVVHAVETLAEAEEVCVDEEAHRYEREIESEVRVEDVKADFFSPTFLHSIRQKVEARVPLCLVGPPGTGKTLLAREIRKMLPKMTGEDVLETARVLSLAGLLTKEWVRRPVRPFRAPHHTVSAVGMNGLVTLLGKGYRLPGEIALANRGVLFLDEMPEFRKDCLESVRYALKENSLFPSNFYLVVAMNPCPCGWYGSTTRPCVCSTEQVRRYNRRVEFITELCFRINMVA